MGVFAIFYLMTIFLPPIAMRFLVPGGVRWSYAVMITGTPIFLLGYSLIPPPGVEDSSEDDTSLAATMYMATGAIEFCGGGILWLAGLIQEKLRSSSFQS
ncbi:MAG: hypothetical protein LBE84_10375 [Planctomycetota bacterium]|jgi:hypothetical protein|nr:hypothetical protein [Planctomycetota bacterium]